MFERFATMVLVLLLLNEVNAQDAPTPAARWSYSTEVFQNTMLHFNIRAYHSHGRWAFGVHGGFRPSLRSGGEIPAGGPGNSYFNINHRNWMYQAVTLGPVARYHLKDGRSFMELDAFHRIWWFDRKDVFYDNVESIRFNGLRSERQNISAIRLLWGAHSATRVDRSGRHALVVEGYSGFGVRTRNMRFTTHEGTLDSFDPPIEVTEDRVDRYRFVTPTIHLGLRLALVPRIRTP